MCGAATHPHTHTLHRHKHTHNNNPNVQSLYYIHTHHILIGNTWYLHLQIHFYTQNIYIFIKHLYSRPTIDIFKREHSQMYGAWRETSVPASIESFKCNTHT